jgi:thiamine-monophosphate kinase
MTDPAFGTVGDLGERAIIERIRTRLPPPPPWVAIGIGDDAAVVRPERNRAEVITTDSFVEGVHFDRAYVPPAAIGHKSLAVNLSDLAAMGAEPRAALLSLVLPATLLVSDLDAILDGFLALADRYEVALVGGNIARSPGPLVLDVTATGVVKPRRVMTRAGARPGDDIYVSGEIGAAAAGLALCRTGQCEDVAGGAGRVADPDQQAAGSDASACRRRFLAPEPRMRLGQLLGRNAIATACVDLSDGLADAVQQLGAASGVGAIIEADVLPVPAAARSALAAGRGDWLEAALAGGEDYELLFTAPSRRRRKLQGVLQHARGLTCTRIGRVTANTALVLRRAGADAPLPQGFAHFR